MDAGPRVILHVTYFRISVSSVSALLCSNVLCDRYTVLATVLLHRFQLSRFIVCFVFLCSGQLGNGGTTNSPSAYVPVVGLTGMAKIYAHDSYSCALDSAGSAWCWGFGTDKRLGNGVAAHSSVPVQAVCSGVPCSGLWRHISTGSSGTTCGVDSDYNGYCWGSDNSVGLTGTGSGGSSLIQIPTMLNAPGKKWKRIDVTGLDHACGLLHDTALPAYDQLMCWGSNAQGQLGNPSIATSSDSPVALAAPYDTYTWIDFGVGGRFTAAIRRADYSLYTWGTDVGGSTAQNAPGVTFPTPTKAISPLGPGAVCYAGKLLQLAVGFENVFVIEYPNILCQSGPDTNEASGLTGGSTYLQKIPGVTALIVQSFAYTSSVLRNYATGGPSYMGLWATYGGKPTCSWWFWHDGGSTGLEPIPVGYSYGSQWMSWGSGSSGMFGDGSTADRDPPASDPGVVDRVYGFQHGCFIAPNGRLTCAGINGNGQLGDGSTGSSTTPVPVKWTSFLAPVGSGPQCADGMPEVPVQLVAPAKSHTCALIACTSTTVELPLSNRELCPGEAEEAYCWYVSHIYTFCLLCWKHQTKS
jgi:alpha-tubulin suppressor-like RCC1 family protein